MDVKTKEYIRRIREIHGDRYDLSKIKSIPTVMTKLPMSCPEHGDFQISFNVIQNRGRGCPECGKLLRSANKMANRGKRIVDDFRKVHGDKYDYSKMVYMGVKEKVEIVCPRHGSFWQIPDNHLLGHGCPDCGRRDQIRSIQDRMARTFETKFREVHGDKYDYSRVVYTESKKTKLEIVCPDHGSFFQTFQTHVRGVGCPDCYAEGRALSQEEFERKANEVHGGAYTYTKSKYTRSHEKVLITCSIHGDFEQSANGHLQGARCPDCSKLSQIEKQLLPKEEFVRRSRDCHGDKYSYEKSIFRGVKAQITVTCDIHGDFSQMAENHMNGNGCPKCAFKESKLEAKVCAILDEMGVKYERNVWFGEGRNRWEIDVYVPSKNFGIECHGNYWHSEAKKSPEKARTLHYDKFAKALELGITLVQFFEDEINDLEGVVRSMIAHRLKGSSEKVHARKCDLLFLQRDEMDAEAVAEIDSFFDANHIQGTTKFKAAALLLHEGEIVGCMLMNRVISARGQKEDPSKAELVRLAFSKSVPGGASRMLRCVEDNMSEVTEILSYSDNRFGVGNVYENLGFKLEGEVKPDYRYVSEMTNSPRIHKSSFRRSAQERMAARGEGYSFDPAMTEVQNANANGYYRLWNAGLLRWVKRIDRN